MRDTYPKPPGNSLAVEGSCGQFDRHLAEDGLLLRSERIAISLRGGRVVRV